MHNILIVDDDRIEVSGLSRLISQRYKACVFCAYSGAQALVVIRNEPLDVMITDIRMPNMDGLELITQARAINKNLKTILYSAYSEFEYAKQAIKLQVSSYIVKPLNPLSLYEELDPLMEQKESQTPKKSAADAAEQAKAYIESHYPEDLTLEQLASSVFVTPNYLCYIFKLKNGVTPMKYLTIYRLKRAKALLESTNMRVSEIMLECGFTSSSYFSTAFKVEYGLTPSEYREHFIRTGK